jgi:hypothetical protein
MAALDTEDAATPKRFAPALRAGFRAAVAVLYPPSCIGCGGATGVAHALCARCWAEVRFIERPYCERLGTPLPVDLGVTLLSPAAMVDPPVFDPGAGGGALRRRGAQARASPEVLGPSRLR